jgi:hypothetical protein
MLELLPAWAWILIALVIVMAAAMLVDRINKCVRLFVLGAAQDLNDVLSTFSKSDNELRAWSRERLLEIEAQCRSLLAKSEELYSHTRRDVEAAWRRVGKILSEKGDK